MPYSKTNWIDGTTEITAALLNNAETQHESAIVDARVENEPLITEVVSSFPAHAAGKIIFHDGENKFYCSTGSQWLPVSPKTWEPVFFGDERYLPMTEDDDGQGTASFEEYGLLLSARFFARANAYTNDTVDFRHIDRIAVHIYEAPTSFGHIVLVIGDPSGYDLEDPDPATYALNENMGRGYHEFDTSALTGEYTILIGARVGGSITYHVKASGILVRYS